MGRKCDAETYAALVGRLRAAMPSVALSTDVIVGFPGESEEDFAETERLCRESGFMKLHVFPYSRREGTPAAARPDQVDAATKQARARRLRTLSDELRRADFNSRLHTTEEAIAEEDGWGTTESYHRVHLGRDVAPGDLVPYTFKMLQ